MNPPYDPKVLRQLIKDTLTPLGLYSENAEELLMLTCAQESHLGVYRTQIKGPARGIFQCEGNTFEDYYNGYLKYHPDLEAKVQALAPDPTQRPHVDDLVNDDKFAIAICRIHYLRIGPPIPQKDDLDGLWLYYKKWYNSWLGAATRDEVMANYKKYVLQS
jgi:hypothetical protein